MNSEKTIDSIYKRFYQKIWMVGWMNYYPNDLYEWKGRFIVSCWQRKRKVFAFSTLKIIWKYYKKTTNKIRSVLPNQFKFFSLHFINSFNIYRTYPNRWKICNFLSQIQRHANWFVLGQFQTYLTVKCIFSSVYLFLVGQLEREKHFEWMWSCICIFPLWIIV